MNLRSPLFIRGLAARIPDKEAFPPLPRWGTGDPAPPSLAPLPA